MTRHISLSSARGIAPQAFRRWVISATSLAVLGYATFLVLDAREHGIASAIMGRNSIMTLLSLCAVAFSTRGNPVVGGMITLTSTWLEVETQFLIDPVFPSAGILILPVLLLGFGLLLGARAACVVAAITVVSTIATHLQSPTMQRTGLTAESMYFFAMHTISIFSTWALLYLSLSGFGRVFEAMEANEQDLADTIRFAPDGILVTDRKHLVRLANPAAERLLGLSSDRLIPRTVEAILTDAAARRDQLDAIVRETGQTPLELQLAAGDGTAVHIEATWRGMEAGRRQLLLRDISQRVRAEEQRRAMELQLSHAQRLDAVGRLAGGLSHDFNNILTAVSGSAELLRGETDPTERDELLDEIIAARDRGAALTRQLLAFARREVTQPRVIDLAEHVRSLERLLQRVAGDRQRLRLELEPECRVRVDPGQLEQALVNLVANARDAMPGGGCCTVRVSRTVTSGPGARVLLDVIDEGVGMSVDIASRAFEPFFTTKARGQGTGLGLASVHGMAEQSDGSARIVSTPAKGTHVTIDLPAVDEAATPVVVQPVISAPHTGPRSILVAEDDSGTRRIVERILQHAGYRVTTAADGTEAMALLDAATTSFDFVLTDVMMPGHTGLEIADRARALSPGTPVLLMTGYAEEQLGDLLSGRPEREVITKPFSGSALTLRIAELLQSSSPPATATAAT